MIGLYLVDTVYRIRQPRDKWGEKYGDPITTKMSGKVDLSKRMITDKAGRQVVAQATVLMGKTVLIDEGDKLRIDGVEYTVIGSKRRSDFASRYIEVYI